jgi:L-glyceraldehyde 3-phosphate reductase
MALAWVLRGGRVTSALVGASSPQQLEDSVTATRHLDFAEDELVRIDAIVNP